MSGRANRVALGVGLSRILGLVREAIAARVFGLGPVGDVWTAVFRLPNLLQTLLGDQVLAASFIPIYSRLLAEGRHREAGRFAGVIFSLLFALAAGLALLGILFARPLVWAFNAGWAEGDARRLAEGGQDIDRLALAVPAVQVLFVMTALLVLSAWALGVLNSHRRFFVPAAAPTLWNTAIISAFFMGGGATLWQGGTPSTSLMVSILTAGCWGALLGGFLQFGVQLPFVYGLIQGFRPSFNLKVEGVSQAIRAFLPVVSSRGILQLSGYFDLFVASFLVAGTQAAIGNTYRLYLLPISLFALSVVAVELPELSTLGGGAGARDFALRVQGALCQTLYLVVPTAVGFWFFGYLIVSLVYRGSNFGEAESWVVYLTLALYTVGLLPSVASRLLQNSFYALNQAAVPARASVERMIMGTIAGALLAIFLFNEFSVSDWVNLPPEIAEEPYPHLGALGLAIGASLGGIYEFTKLWRRLGENVPDLSFPLRSLGQFGGTALGCSLLSFAVWWALRSQSLILMALPTLGVYALSYLAIGWWRGTPELRLWLRR